MTNLKTDDILGARPRIRHAPRSLIRQQKLAQQYQDYSPHIDNQNYGYNPGNQYQHQYPYNRLSDNSNYNHKKEQPRYSQNFEMSRSYMQRSPAYAGKSSDRIHQNNNVVDRYDEQIRNRASQRLFIKPKDAPVINYNQYQKLSDDQRNKIATTYTRAYNNVNKDLYDRYHYSPKGNRVQPVQVSKSRQINSYQIPKYEQRKQSSRSSSLDTSQIQKRKQQQKPQQSRIENAQQTKNRNIFRGLGFNIITNTKFQYGMQNRYLNNTSRYLQ